MATINLGAIKFNWKGAYNSGTSYAVDDVVSSGGNSYVCIQAHSNQAVGNATAYWNIMSSKGTDADLLNISSTAQGDIYYNNGSAIARLGAGTSGQALITGGASANPSWGTISSGTYSVHAFGNYNYASNVSYTGSTNSYLDIAGGNYLSFTPTSTDDYIHFVGWSTIYIGAVDRGANVYVNFGTSTSLGSSDTKFGLKGTHTHYGGGSGSRNDEYASLELNLLMPCTGLTAGTTYYAEMAGAVHGSSGTIEFNNGIGGAQTGNQHNLSFIHHKKN
jgi:hypothetical protein